MDHCHSNLIDRLEFVSATYKDDYSCNIEVSNATTADLGEWRMSLEDYGTGNWIVQVFNVTNVPTEEAVTVRPKHGPDQELPDLPVLRGIWLIIKYTAEINLIIRLDCYLPDTSFRGHDVPYEGVRDAASAEQCQDYCIDSPECYFWKWNDPHSSPKSVGRVKGKCMLKTWTAVPGMRAQRGAVRSISGMFREIETTIYIQQLPAGVRTQVLSRLLQVQHWLLVQSLDDQLSELEDEQHLLLPAEVPTDSKVSGVRVQPAHQQLLPVPVRQRNGRGARSQQHHWTQRVSERSVM